MADQVTGQRFQAIETLRHGRPWCPHEIDDCEVCKEEWAAALADLQALAAAAEGITFAVWENDDDEVAAATCFRAALARVKGEQA